MWHSNRRAPCSEQETANCLFQSCESKWISAIAKQLLFCDQLSSLIVLEDECARVRKLLHCPMFLNFISNANRGFVWSATIQSEIATFFVDAVLSDLKRALATRRKCEFLLILSQTEFWEWMLFLLPWLWCFSHILKGAVSGYLCQGHERLNSSKCHKRKVFRQSPGLFSVQLNGKLQLWHNSLARLNCPLCLRCAVNSAGMTSRNRKKMSNWSLLKCLSLSWFSMPVVNLGERN